MATKAALSKIKVIAIIASLAGLALVLSPTFSVLQAPGATTNTGANSLLQDEVIEEDATVIEQVSNEDLAACGSVNESLDEILGVVNDTIDDRKVASDRLIAEFCSRPVLIHEIMSTDYQSLSLVAYACDASSGKIGTAAMQDSLSDHNEIYCDSASQIIMNESNTFLETVEQVRTEYLPLFEAGLEDEEDSEGVDNETGSFDDDDLNASTQDEDVESSYFNVTAAEIILDEVSWSLEKSIALVDAGEYYAAAKSFDNASKKFIALFQDEAEA